MGPSASETKTAQSVALSPQCYHIRTSLAGKFLIYAVIFSCPPTPNPPLSVAIAGTDKGFISRCWLHIRDTHIYTHIILPCFHAGETDKTTFSR